jgi:ABC-type Fe3+ transport system substrate-binding protein
MYVDEKRFSANTKAFTDYLTSKDGQKLVSEAGFIPIR